MCTVYVQQHVLQLTRRLLALGEGWRCALFRVIDLWVQNTRVCMPTVRCEPGSNSHVTSLPGKRRSGSPHEGGDKAKKRVSQFSNVVGWGGRGCYYFPCPAADKAKLWRH